MKRRIFVGLISLFFVVGIASVGMADNKLADTSQLGTLLIFPKVLVDSGYYSPYDGGYKSTETIIQITNTANFPVRVRCYWVTPDAQCSKPWNYSESGGQCGPPACENYYFDFGLTARQPIWFRASDGAGLAAGRFPKQDGYGELKCFAINENNVIVKWNYLKGEATIVKSYPHTIAKYNAWSFMARGAANDGRGIGLRLVAEDGTVDRKIHLSGRGVIETVNGEEVRVPNVLDACPKYLHVNFFAEDAVLLDKSGDGSLLDEEGIDRGSKHIRLFYNDLALVPCKQDFTNGGPPTVTKLEFDITNQNEVTFGNIWDCMVCMYEEDFGHISERTHVDWLFTDAGYMRVWTRGNNACDIVDGDGNVLVPAITTGLVGVHLDKWAFAKYGRFCGAEQEECPDEGAEGYGQGYYGGTATNPFGSGRITTDFILYTPNP